MTLLKNGPLSEEEWCVAPGSGNQKQESGCRVTTAFYTIRDHAQVGWYLKGYWLKE